MRTVKTLLAAVVVGFTIAATSAWHIELVSSFPTADTVLTEAPSELLLTFSADLDFPRSAATMRSPAGTPVKLGEPQATNDPRQMKLAIADELGAGTYTVSWTAAPKDDHGGRGRFRFEVR
jgi:methionine-rich copper-binding protein CopC